MSHNSLFSHRNVTCPLSDSSITSFWQTYMRWTWFRLLNLLIAFNYVDIYMVNLIPIDYSIYRLPLIMYISFVACRCGVMSFFIFFLLYFFFGVMSFEFFTYHDIMFPLSKLNVIRNMKNLLLFPYLFVSYFNCFFQFLFIVNNSKLENKS